MEMSSTSKCQNRYLCIFMVQVGLTHFITKFTNEGSHRKRLNQTLRREEKAQVEKTPAPMTTMFLPTLS